MHFKCLLALFIFWVALVPFNRVSAWGFYAHKKINQHAVYSLPMEMQVLYKYHADYIREHAVDPDKRKRVVENEACNHYIDIDHYDKDKPFEAVPQVWDSAVIKFTEDTLLEYGIAPWHIFRVFKQLVAAFEAGDTERILKLSADLGHYVSDIHVPLHTTENYDGQLTGQRGIHGLWESRIPELEAENYNYWVGAAEEVKNLNTFIWEIVQDSHYKVDSVLTLEAKLNSQFSSDKKYTMEARGKGTRKNYALKYASAYSNLMNGMVERQMRKSMKAVSDIWHTAWVRAGKPDLKSLISKNVIQSGDNKLGFPSKSLKFRACELHER